MKTQVQGKLPMHLCYLSAAFSKSLKEVIFCHLMLDYVLPECHSDSPAAGELPKNLIGVFSPADEIAKRSEQLPNTLATDLKNSDSPLEHSIWKQCAYFKYPRVRRLTCTAEADQDRICVSHG